MYDVYREVVITTKWTKLKKRVAVRRKKLLELTKLVGVFRDIEDVQGALNDLEVLLNEMIPYIRLNQSEYD